VRDSIRAAQNSFVSANLLRAVFAASARHKRVDLNCSETGPNWLENGRRTVRIRHVHFKVTNCAMFYEVDALLVHDQRRHELTRMRSNKQIDLIENRIEIHYLFSRSLEMQLHRLLRGEQFGEDLM
jgi:hypothetical protein